MISRKAFYTFVGVIAMLVILLASHHFTGHPGTVNVGEVVHLVEGILEKAESNPTETVSDAIIKGNQAVINKGQEKIEAAVDSEKESEGE